MEKLQKQAESATGHSWELKNMIRNNEKLMAKEIEISYQSSKKYKKLKKEINKIKKNKIMSLPEKKQQIRETVYDSIFYLQINNNEKNACQKEEAIKKRKEKREEKRVQKQLQKQNQNELQERIKNLILQQDITSPNLNNLSSDEISEEESKEQQYDAEQENRMIPENNKYMQIINNNNESLNYNHVIDQYSDEIEDSSQLIPNNTEYTGQEQEESTSQQKEDVEQQSTNQQIKEVQINNYTQNNAALTQLLSQNNNLQPNKEQQTVEEKISAEEHNKYVQEHIREMSPPPQNQNSKRKSNFQLFKELKTQAIKQQNDDLIKNANIMDSTKSADSEITREMEKQFALNHLYDWKFIYNQKLYISSNTQNIFNLKTLQSNKYDQNQLISYNTTTKDIDMLNISNPCKNTIKENMVKDPKYQTTYNIVVIFNKNIAEQIFKNYSIQELQKQAKENIKDYNGQINQGNDTHVFIMTLAQALKKIVDINYEEQDKQIELKYAHNMEHLPEFCKQERAEITMCAVSNDTDKYNIFILKQNDDPTPFYNKNKQFF